MAQILMPQRQQPEVKKSGGFLPDNALSGLGALAGGLAGAAGGPAGIIAGASAGSSLGGMAQGVVDPVKYSQDSVSQVASVETNGMDRRRNGLGEDPVQAINQARAALNGLPPTVLPETRKSFEDALELAKRNQILA